ncbi:ATP-dependent Clp protease adaptor ClpS [Plebeiibacterium sediminum]|uniref:ATP-dependent Clp protease adaptor ClpS n=1 Tax=Plebeiibacterium sediminum TaxID=2992112 RepID=A0AAE3M4V4_9BACT|nr:ATP-dependent Clp protease adaptor ClpS [Plebeiobacterium sediminum]MCW3786860.1 ATP-dependent Clp protease adaptor ClpS [Plebeiobacterium sediminum]
MADTLTKKKTKEELDKLYKSTLILWNDDFNTFDFVIECLMKYCKHTIEQAEQCSLIVHYKGKCDVKSGSEKELLPIKNILIDCGLSVTIE